MENKQKHLEKYSKIRLKKMAHHLKPVVQVGRQGLTPGVIAEIKQNLEAHELIKVAFLPVQKPELANTLAQITESCGALLVATMGNVAILFRPNATSEFEADHEIDDDEYEDDE